MNFIKKSGVHNHIISDHLPVYMTRKKDRNRKEYTVIEVRNSKNYDKVTFQREISNDFRWLDYWHANTVTEKWKVLNQIILDCLNKLAPTCSEK